MKHFVLIIHGKGIKEIKGTIWSTLNSYIGNTYKEELTSNIIYNLYDD